MTASDGRSAELAARIRREIAAAGPMTFARFMELALYEPELGYYRQTIDRPTGAGDFLTAPEAHPIFGWTLSRQIEELWRLLGEPATFRLVEYGAGSGSLGLAIVNGLRRRSSPLASELAYEPVEDNRYRRADVRQRFAGAGLAGCLREANDEPFVGVALANELLDALPVHRLVVRNGVLCELFVSWQDGFVELAGPPTEAALGERLAADGVELAEGQQVEVCLALGPWLDMLSARLRRGYALIVDYGYPAAELYGPRHMAGSLLGYARHRVRTNPLEDVGAQDLTAHVDFTAVERLAAERGLACLGLTTQRDFLVGCGLEAELRALQAAPETDVADYARARAAIVRLLDPRAMGRFRVMILGREVGPQTPMGLVSGGATRSS